MSDLIRPSRRGIIGAIGLLIASPAIVRATNLMKLSPQRAYLGQWRGIPIYQVDEIAKLLTQSNDLFDDMTYVGTIRTFRTSIPSATWRVYNHGVLIPKTQVPCQDFAPSPKQNPCHALPFFRHNPPAN